MKDLIERLWVAHGELPGRQGLMREAIEGIQTCDHLRAENDRLRADCLELYDQLAITLGRYEKCLVIMPGTTADDIEFATKGPRAALSRGRELTPADAEGMWDDIYYEDAAALASPPSKKEGKG